MHDNFWHQRILTSEDMKHMTIIFRKDNHLIRMTAFSKWTMYPSLDKRSLDRPSVLRTHRTMVSSARAVFLHVTSERNLNTGCCTGCTCCTRVYYTCSIHEQWTLHQCTLILTKTFWLAWANHFIYQIQVVLLGTGHSLSFQFTQWKLRISLLHIHSFDGIYTLYIYDC